MVPSLSLSPLAANEKRKKGTERGRLLAFVARVDHVTSRTHACDSERRTYVLSEPDHPSCPYSGQR